MSTSQSDDETRQQNPTQSGGLSLGPGAQITVGQGDVVAGDKIVIQSKEDARTWRDQLILLGKVKGFWVKGVLEKSVHKEALIELGKQTQIEAVEHPWEVMLKTPEQGNQPLPPEKKIVEIFDELGRNLLILGAPGSGKTITLLELARDLVARAESDPAQPIPVVFNLSTWAERRQPLAEWLTAELSVKYQVPRQIGRKWLAANDILPLLDGLDEVQVEHRAACIETLNTYLDSHGLAGLVVCSRVEDYASIKPKLKLEAAILLQPLTDEQVKEYLGAVGGVRLHPLYKALQADETLREMSQSPLMLSVMSIAYADVMLDDLLSGALNTLEARRKHLFAAYTERMFARVARTKNELYPKAQTVRWLAGLARGMKQHGQAVFLIEELQPSWPGRRLERWVYAIGSRSAGGLLFGLALGSGLAVVSGLPEVTAAGLSLLSLVLAVIRMVTGALLGLFGGATAGLIAGLRFEWNARHPLSQIRSKQNLWRLALNLLAAGLGPGSVLGVVLFILALADAGGSFRTSLMVVVTAFLFFAMPLGLVFSVLFGLIFGSRGSGQYLQTDVPTVEALHWSWEAAIRGAAGGLAGGSIAGAMLGSVFAVGALLVVAVERSLPIIPARVPLTFLVPMCVCGGTMSFLGAAIFGLINGLRSKKVETKLIPNQGLRQSAGNAVFSGLLFGVGGMFIVGAAVWLAGAISALFTANRFETSLNLLPLWGALLGILGGMYNGGFAVVQHYTLRLILAVAKSFPWNIARFLDYCADRIFLRKVGGGYIFIHRSLLEYFAERGG